MNQNIQAILKEEVEFAKQKQNVRAEWLQQLDKKKSQLESELIQLKSDVLQYRRQSQDTEEASGRENTKLQEKISSIKNEIKASLKSRSKDVISAIKKVLP